MKRILIFIGLKIIEITALVLGVVFCSYLFTPIVEIALAFFWVIVLACFLVRQNWRLAESISKWKFWRAK